MKFAIVFVTVLCLWFCPMAGAKDEVIRISTSYRNLLSTSECSGMLDQIVMEAFRRIGVKAEIVFTNTRRSLVAVNAGQIDGEINRIEGIEKNYPNLVRVLEPNMRMKFVAFARREIAISDWESLRGLRIGMVQGWKILESNTRGFPNIIRLTEVSTLFTMLEMNRLDVVLYSKLTGYEELHKLGYDDIQHLSPALSEQDMFLYLHKSHEKLGVPLAEALREMKKDGTYDKIVNETTCHLH